MDSLMAPAIDTGELSHHGFKIYLHFVVEEPS